MGGSAGDSFMSSKSHVPNFPHLGFMGLVHESHFKHFKHFLTSICQSLNNLVSAPLPLEVQFLGKMMEFHDSLGFS